MEELVSKKVLEKPEAMYKQFLLIVTETYSIPLDDVPAKGYVKKKISAFKQKSIRRRESQVWCRYRNALNTLQIKKSLNS